MQLSQLSPDLVLCGFRAASLYTDHANEPVGARFIHERTNFVYDIVFIDSAPQAFLWVTTLPVSDRGEPHTQEHLLLGKGQKGRYVAGVEAMSLAESSAYTMQWRTCYHFHVTAGAAAYWRVFEHKLDGLLHPDYTDEEVRREVCHLGVVADAASGSLSLEEKGTLYTEMVRAFEQPAQVLFRTLGHMCYGPTHPLALSAGGVPAAIRELGPDDIHAFHQQCYHLGNMGAIAAFPRSMGLAEILGRTDEIFARLAPAPGEPRSSHALDRARDPGTAAFPAPEPAPAGMLAVVSYPHRNPSQPGTIALVWPPRPELSLVDDGLLDLCLSAFVSGSGSPLHKRFIASESRAMDFGATGVWHYISPDLGRPIFIGLSDVKAELLTEETVAAVRDAVMDELARIAGMAPGSAELRAFLGQIQSRLVATRRWMQKFLSAPPGFGSRGVSASWMQHLDDLARVQGFTKSLTFAPVLAEIEALLAGSGNPFTERLSAWGLLGTVPYGAACKADPRLAERELTERMARMHAAAGRLVAEYGVSSAQEALRRFQADDARAAAELEARARDVVLPAVTEAPPLTQDDQLVYEVTEVSGVALVASSFASMSGGTLGLALDLHGVAEDDLMYLGALPGLFTEVGLYEDGAALTHDAMAEAMRREILGVNVYLSGNYRSGRAELVLRGSGNDAEEALRAVDWLERILYSANWRVENLSRITDVVDSRAKRLQNRMLGAEETWVTDPAAAYTHQESTLLAHTQSFLTAAHHAHRMRWLMRDGGPDTEALTSFLHELANSAGALGREALAALAAAPDRPEGAEPGSMLAALSERFTTLPAGAKALAALALGDIGRLLSDLPDTSLADDVAYLCRQIAADVMQPPAEVLGRITRIRDLVAHQGGARLFAIASPSVHERLRPRLAALLARLTPTGVPRPQTAYSARRFIDERVRRRAAKPEARQPDAPLSRYLGLLNPSTQSGALVFTAPSLRYGESAEEDAVLDYLTSNLFAGQGAHSLFMKTWGAGLAYGNGVRASLDSGRLMYYAERCPDVAQTLRFVVSELGRAALVPGMGDYAVAEAFSSRVAGSFEGRGEAMAADLADGITPERVAALRRQILHLREREPHAEALASELFARRAAVLGRVLPGYGAAAPAQGAVYFAVGPRSQLDSLQAYLRAEVDAGAEVQVLYPRDFWLVARV